MKRSLTSRLAPLLTALIAVFVWCPVEQASALRLDPELHGICGAECSTDSSGLATLSPLQLQIFSEMSRAYGIALAPLMISPANTIGINAVEADFSFAFGNLTDSGAVWAGATEGKREVSQLSTVRFSLRKGLPYSFEIEGQLGYLINSELWTLGGGVKWALHEAIAMIPVDINIHGGISRLVGSTQLDLTMVTFGGSLGTQFGVLGLFNLAPFVNYQPVMIFAGSSTLDATPGQFDPPGDTAGGVSAFVFPRTEELVQRVSGGVRFLFGALRITPEYLWTPHQQSVNVSLGLNL